VITPGLCWCGTDYKASRKECCMWTLKKRAEAVKCKQLQARVAAAAAAAAARAQAAADVVWRAQEVARSAEARWENSYSRCVLHSVRRDGTHYVPKDGALTLAVHACYERELWELEKRLSHDMYDERRFNDGWFEEEWGLDHAVRRQDYFRLFYLAAATGGSTFITLPTGRDFEVEVQVVAEARARAEGEKRATKRARARKSVEIEQILSKARAREGARAAREAQRKEERRQREKREERQRVEKQRVEMEERQRVEMEERARKRARESAEEEKKAEARASKKAKSSKGAGTESTQRHKAARGKVCPVCHRVFKSELVMQGHLRDKQDWKHQQYRRGSAGSTSTAANGEKKASGRGPAAVGFDASGRGDGGRSSSQKHPAAARRQGSYGGDRYHGFFGRCSGGCIGSFSADDENELAMQGVNPWDDDAGAVLAALNGDYYIQRRW